MSLSQLEQAVGHGRRVRSREAEARKHRGEVKAAVESVAEFSQVTRQMLGTDLMISAVQGILDVTDDGVEPAKLLHLDAGGTATGNHRLVFNASGGNTVKLKFHA